MMKQIKLKRHRIQKEVFRKYFKIIFPTIRQTPQARKQDMKAEAEKNCAEKKRKEECCSGWRTLGSPG